ncbi:MAG: RNA polymerase sigma-70 factor [Chitinophagaceae bacterium]|nr:RNA polymerase sigma-70 factor [Chitinophagaceae bacterium]
MITALRLGNEDAFTEVYKRLYQRIYLFANKFVDQAADAQDLTAETFAQLWQRRQTFSSMDAVRAFLFVTVRNRCFNLLRHRNMKEERRSELLQLLESEDTGDFYLEQVHIEVMRRIYAEVEKLPPRMKEIFLLSYQEGLKPAQIAERLQIKVQTVTNQRVSAIRLLQSVLRGDPLAIAFLLLLLENERGFLS